MDSSDDFGRIGDIAEMSKGAKLAWNTFQNVHACCQPSVQPAGRTSR